MFCALLALFCASQCDVCIVYIHSTASSQTFWILLQSVSCRPFSDQATPLLYPASLFNMTTIPLCWVYLECILSLRWPLPFSTRGFGQTAKNRQMIAITLRLRFAARINNRCLITHPMTIHDLVYVYKSLIKFSLLQGSTFFVAANESITVRSITVHGTTITSAKEQLGKPTIVLQCQYRALPGITWVVVTFTQLY